MLSSRTLLLAATAVLLAGPGQAQDRNPELAFNVGGATDYVFRGVSQTAGKAQIFAGADLTHDRLYAGAWLSNVEAHDGASAEYDLYAGFRPQAGPVALDLGLTYYGYAHRPAGAREAYYEFKAAGSVPLGKATLGAAAAYSPEFRFGRGQATYVEINGSTWLNDRVQVSGALGHQSVTGPGGYAIWNLGVGYVVTPHLGFDLRYWDTDGRSLGRDYGSKVVLGVKAAF
jgi:uncharacterized protein (TIGR02001 family)